MREQVKEPLLVAGRYILAHGWVRENAPHVLDRWRLVRTVGDLPGVREGTLVVLPSYDDSPEELRAFARQRGLDVVRGG